MATEKYKIAVFAGGCFWCTEAVFLSLKGVISVKPGYTGGTKSDPTYEDVLGGTTGHAESIKIEYDPLVISFDDLLAVFFNTHDPTTLNRQDGDIGTQYRSAVFCPDRDQRQRAEAVIRELNEARAYDAPVVTEVEPLGKFYEAEDYHLEYYKNHQDQPYCRLVIVPKLERLTSRFSRLMW